MINFAELKKFFIFNFIGSLIIAALVAVVTVLIGHFNEITTRVFMTLFMVILHSLISLFFIWDDSRRNTFEKLAFFVNTVFILIVLSFLNSLFGIWKIISSETVWHVYQTFFIVAFAALHADILSKALRKEKYMDAIIAGNYCFIILVVLMLQPIIFTQNAYMVLGEMYYRFLAAAAIIDGTLSILTIIFYKLYMHKHPEVQDMLSEGVPTPGGKPARKGLSIWVWILLIYLVFQMGFPLVFFIFGGLFRGY